MVPNCGNIQRRLLLVGAVLLAVAGCARESASVKSVVTAVDGTVLASAETRPQRNGPPEDHRSGRSVVVARQQKGGWDESIVRHFRSGHGSCDGDQCGVPFFPIDAGTVKWSRFEAGLVATFDYRTESSSDVALAAGNWRIRGHPGNHRMRPGLTSLPASADGFRAISLKWYKSGLEGAGNHYVFELGFGLGDGGDAGGTAEILIRHVKMTVRLRSAR